MDEFTLFVADSVFVVVELIFNVLNLVVLGRAPTFNLREGEEVLVYRVSGERVVKWGLCRKWKRLTILSENRLQFI